MARLADERAAEALTEAYDKAAALLVARGAGGFAWEMDAIESRDVVTEVEEDDDAEEAGDEADRGGVDGAGADVVLLATARTTARTSRSSTTASAPGAGSPEWREV